MEGGVLVVVSSFSVPLAFVPGERLPLELGGTLISRIGCSLSVPGSGLPPFLFTQYLGPQD